MTVPGWAVEAWRAAWTAAIADDGSDQAAATELARLCVSREEFDRAVSALNEANEDRLWSAYNSSHERNGRWTHMFMSDGEWLACICGFDPQLPDYSADEIKAAFPVAIKALARAALEASNGQ